MGTNFNVLFYAKKKLKTTKGRIPIYLRVTIDGGRFETSVHRQVESDKWAAKIEKAKDNSEEAKSLNDYLDLMRNRAFNFQRELIMEGQDLTVKSFRNKWLGLSGKIVTLLQVFGEHNDKMKLLVGKEFAPLTYVRYETTLEHTKKFLKYKFGVNDIEVRKINFTFVSEFSFWLKSVRNCNQNTTIKYLSNFKKIVLFCIQSGWIDRNPFLGFKMVKKEVIREILTSEDIEKMSNASFASERSACVRDIFLFCCYTGLAYADVKKLKRSEIANGIDGEKWILTTREKTDTPSRIPLLPKAMQLLNKYENHPKCINEDRLLPVLSNQKMNDYLKQIADVSGINKTLTFHIARHTFATTITLSNGVPIETVSKMLGHRSLRTTQHYAKILDLKVSEDMKRLKEKLELSGNITS
jgi:site-specific recombinase XerD